MTIAISLFSQKKVLFALSIIISAFLIGLYIFQLNSLTTLAYNIAEHEEQITQFRYGNADLQAQTFQAVSLKDLAELAIIKNFKKIDTITYLRVSVGPVAQQ